MLIGTNTTVNSFSATLTIIARICILRRTGVGTGRGGGGGGRGMGLGMGVSGHGLESVFREGGLTLLKLLNLRGS